MLLSGNYIQIPMSSAIMNTCNFLLFDILLSTILFWITGTIAGLENSKCAKRREQNQLFLRNPPLIGVGLTTTRRSVFRCLALLRVCGMCVILSTNFLIEGISCEVETTSVENVVVPGKLPFKPDLIELRGSMRRRRSCQGRIPKTREWYFGELRLGKKCELRKDLISTPIVSFGLDMENVTIPLDSFKSCKTKQDRSGMQRAGARERYGVHVFGRGDIPGYKSKHNSGTRCRP